jgi:Transposase DDE domain
VLARLEEHADLEASAREYGALRRARAVRSGAQLMRLVLVYVLSGLSLRGTAAWAEASGEASLSDVALLKRLRGCGPWLAMLCGRLGATACPEAACDEPGPWSGRRVVAVDASAIASPGGRDKAYRLLHTVYDVVAQRFLVTQLSDRHQAEVLDLGGVEAGEIRLGDRVYGRYRDLAAVGAAGADYVVRLSARALKLDSFVAGAAWRFLNRAELCRRAEAEGVQDLPVRIRGAKAAPLLAARLIVLPLPPEQAEAARRVMKKKARKWGYTPSPDALACAGCLMLITSLPSPAAGAPAWPAETVLALYRRRWQVELAFKRLKSVLRLEALRAFDPDLVSAWVHAVLLVALLIDLDRPSVQPEAPDSPPQGRAAGPQSPSGASPPWSPAT